jgi:hypothetical protein
MNTSVQPPTTGTYVKSMKIIFLALLAGQVMFATLAWFMQRLGVYAGFESLVTPLLVLVPLLAASAIGIGIFIFNRRMTELQAKSSLSEKLNDYRAAVIVKYALAEGPVFFAIVAYMLTGNMVILGIALACILYFAFMWPSMERMANQMALNPDEKMKFENQDTRL